jgi:23S rRNA (pseudouridine1915-N3)-methyltransferase
MKIALMLTGKTTEKYIAAGVETYSKRISRYTGFEMITLPDLKNTRNMPAEEQKLREGRKIIQSIGKDDFVVLLDEKGNQFATVEFAGWLEKRLLNHSKRILFIIGGPWGFSEEVHKISNMKLSLSRMTFSHQLVRLLFVEQLYRAFSIIRGEPYHHE